jgi:hypothetical protein
MNAVVEHTNGWVSFVERAMSNDSYSVEKLQALLEVRDRERASAAQRAFNLAMSRVDGEIGPVIRDRLNPGVNRKYATLEAIDAVARPVYSANGISVRFGCAQAPLPGWMRITCTVSHAEGYSETNYLDVPADVATRGRSPVQGVGANITYARRYLLQMCFNIVLQDDDDDDDGEATRPSYREAAASMPRGERVTEREKINHDVPMKTVKMTWTQLLDSIELALQDEKTGPGIDHILNSAQVKEAQAHAKGEVLQRLDRIVFTAEQRRNALDDTAEAAVSETQLDQQADAAWPGMAPEMEQAGA